MLNLPCLSISSYFDKPSEKDYEIIETLRVISMSVMRRLRNDICVEIPHDDILQEALELFYSQKVHRKYQEAKTGPTGFYGYFGQSLYRAIRDKVPKEHSLITSSRPRRYESEETKALKKSSNNICVTEFNHETHDVNTGMHLDETSNKKQVKGILWFIAPHIYEKFFEKGDMSKHGIWPKTRCKQLKIIEKEIENIYQSITCNYRPDKDKGAMRNLKLVILEEFYGRRFAEKRTLKTG